jgi:hypothetical protein
MTEALLVAHAGHWLSGLAFAFAPLTVVAALAAMAIRERRERRR